MELRRTASSGTGLVANAARFSRFLRENGIRVPSSSLLDAIKGLELIDPCRMYAFRDLLRSTFVSRREEWDAFDDLFRRFFMPQDDLPSPVNGGSAEEREGVLEIALGRREDGTTPPAQEPPVAGETAVMLYSPHSLHRERDLRDLHLSESPELAEGLARLLLPLAHRPSRRRRLSIHGKELSFRRLFRKNIQFGGDLIFLDFRQRKIKKRRVILLCDVSGSMDVHTLMILQFAHALRRVEGRTEIFFFSTELTRVTEWFETGDLQRALKRLPSAVGDWGGGTRIGHCLKAFTELYGGRLLAGRPIVMLYSDGWDRGEIPLLERQMSLLKRRAHKVIWLNPLAGMREYQPICRGMSAALPHVDIFLPLSRVQDLLRLGVTLEKLIA